MAGQKVTKLEAARCQLATAIRLYFDDNDPISVHTLARAAAEIIDRLCEANGTPSQRKVMLDSIVPDRKKEVIDALNKAGNFFKHAATSKPHETLDNFSDEQNIFLILMAVDGLRWLGDELPEARVFAAWIAIVEPSLFLEPHPQKQMIDQLFGDIENQPRSAQKESAREALAALQH